MAILRSAKDDVEGGYLKGTRMLAFAEVFTDFLAMADHLLESGYKDPAAALTGAVLENGLRKLSQDSGITVRSGDDLGALNMKLADKAVYSRLVQKEIQTLKAVRDLADHGHFDDYDERQVRRMIESVGDVLSKHF